jgi:hypothetical protein
VVLITTIGGWLRGGRSMAANEFDEYYEDNDYFRYYWEYGEPISDVEFEEALVQCRKIVEV